MKNSFLSFREKVLVCILVIVAAGAFLYKLSESATMFVYHHPYTNTESFKYLQPAVKRIEDILNRADSYIGNDKYNISYIYKNYYGSGFLKHNPVPNDLDFEAGVYLGKYEYDGHNAAQIAINVASKIDVFYTSIFEAVSNTNSSELYFPSTLADTFDNGFAADKYIDSFKQALPEIVAGNQYIYALEKSPIDAPEIKIKVPFVLESDEILISDVPPTTFLSSVIKYNEKMDPSLREVSVIFNFFVDIKDKKTKKVTRVEIIPESFLGERLQISRRLYVPSVFTGMDSYFYLKNLKYLNDDHAYLYNRIYDLKRYTEIVQYNLDKDFMPVKILKRLHQSLDAFSPLMPEEERVKGYAIIDKYLRDPDVARINELQNILYILKQIGKTKRGVDYFKTTGKIEELSDAYDKNVDMLKKNDKFNKEILEQARAIKDGMITQMNQENYPKYNERFGFGSNSDFTYKFNQLYYTIINKQELLDLDAALKKYFYAVGFRKLNIYWLDLNHIAVLKKDVPEGYTPQMLKKAALEANMPDINYLILPEIKNNGKIFVVSSVWLRLSTTQQEEQSFARMKKIFLDDKKNYRPKIKFLLK